MLHDFAEVAAGAVVDAELGEVEVVEVAGDADLLKEVVIADVHLVTESVEVGVLIDTSVVEAGSMVEAVVVAVGWSCSIPPSCYFNLCDKS